jgi:integrase
VAPVRIRALATFLGISDDKTKRSKNSFGNKFAEWRVEAGLPKGLSLHGIRKGLASILTEFGLSNYMTDVVLDHEIGSAATKVYTAGAQRRALAEQAKAEWNAVQWH